MQEQSHVNLIRVLVNSNINKIWFKADFLTIAMNLALQCMVAERLFRAFTGRQDKKNAQIKRNTMASYISSFGSEVEVRAKSI